MWRLLGSTNSTLLAMGAVEQWSSGAVEQCLSFTVEQWSSTQLIVKKNPPAAASEGQGRPKEGLSKVYTLQLLLWSEGGQNKAPMKYFFLPKRLFCLKAKESGGRPTFTFTFYGLELAPQVVFVKSQIGVISSSVVLGRGVCIKEP